MELADLGRQPISPDSPAGEDVRYDPDYESLQKEIDKLSSMAGADGGTDWNMVVQLASTILAAKSKHLMVAVYLAEGLRQTKGLEGFADGAGVLLGLVETFWDTMFPPKARLKGRINAINWWLDRADPFLRELNPDPLDEEFVNGLTRTVDSLDSAIAAQTDDAPQVRRLLEHLRRLPIKPKEPEPSEADSTPDAAAGAQDQAEGGQSASAAMEVASKEDAARAVGMVQTLAGKTAKFLFSENPADPSAYRLNRAAAWLGLMEPPAAANGKDTAAQPADPSYRTMLEELAGQGDWEGLLKASEPMVQVLPFWLDLNRFAAQALERLGSGYAAALQTVRRETASLAERLPCLLDLNFAGGTPFADDATKSWIAECAPAGSDQPRKPAGIEDAIADAVAGAREIAGQDRIGQAIGLLQERVDSASGGDRLRWRIALATFLSERGLPVIARPYLMAILADVDKFGLEEWDRPLALSALKTVYAGLARPGGDGTDAVLSGVMERIIRLDPSGALQLLQSAA